MQTELASLKALFHRPLQWTLCLLHCNEFPLRHVFMTLDGAAKNQLNSYVSGSRAVDFNFVRNQNFPNVQDDIFVDSRQDQNYAYCMCAVGMMDSVDENLMILEVGRLSHALSLTTSRRRASYDAWRVASCRRRASYDANFQCRTNGKLLCPPLQI